MKENWKVDQTEDKTEHQQEASADKERAVLQIVLTHSSLIKEMYLFIKERRIPRLMIYIVVKNKQINVIRGG